MNGHEKSDRLIVPKKSSNKGGAEKRPKLAEGMEGSGRAKGNPLRDDTHRTQSRNNSVPNALERIRQAAQQDKKMRFTALFHHICEVENLRAAYMELSRSAAPGVDGETWRHYGEKLEENLQDLSQRLARGAYRAKVVRRVYIPKPDGRQRPLGVPTLEDKLVQRATVRVLNAIYETDFLGFSYGFRPGRSAHNALDAVWMGLMRKPVNWVLDADIRGFFDAIDHGWLVKFLEHRIGDRRVLRLIQKWLKAGVLDDGVEIWSDTGTPQGGSASPLLANVYLHYVFDLWVAWWRRRHARGDVIVVRYADDFVLGFQYREDAEAFYAALKLRLGRFGLELHEDKSRLIEFGRYAVASRRRQSLGKPETFNFLGFTHVCGKTKRGKFIVDRRTERKRQHKKLKSLRSELRRRRHAPVDDTGRWIRSVVAGHCRYYGVPGNGRALATFTWEVAKAWRRQLGRRSQRGRITVLAMRALTRRWLPPPRICHPYPNARLHV